MHVQTCAIAYATTPGLYKGDGDQTQLLMFVQQALMD